MSLKSLAILVFVLVSCVFGSVHCYLAADRTVHAKAPVVKPDCCNTSKGCPNDVCDAEIMIEAPLQVRRSSHRLPLAIRRRDATNLLIAPTPDFDSSSTAPRGS